MRDVREPRQHQPREKDADLAPAPIEPEQPEAPVDADPVPSQQPEPPAGGDGDDILALDTIGDIPPPPIPKPPIVGPGVGGIRGTEAGTFSLPGTRGIVPFRTSSYASPARPRFGPGVPVVGGGSTGVSGLGDPDAIGELLRELAAGRGPQ